MTTFGKILEIVVGLMEIESSMNSFSYSPTVIVSHLQDQWKPIKAAIEFIQNVDKAAIHDIEHRDNTYTLTIDNKKFKQFFVVYRILCNHHLFDGKHQMKEIRCKDFQEALMYFPFISALAKIGAYSGYSYDHTTKSLIAFQ
ncbi:MAG TPA: hypothetical protein VFM18_13525 [Methanosarcina sp.]|nr:hypothetical protein [Methanosarcina sp.]